MRIFFVLLLISLLACKKEEGEAALANLVAPVSTDSDSASAVSSTDQFMDLVNKHRESLGLSPLMNDENLVKIVSEHSSQMADGSVSFGHTGFSARCSEGRLAVGGGNWCGENVAKGQKTAQAAFSAWMSSSGHRANIENAKATHTGLGFKQSADGTYYWTQIFIEHN